jgi:hypothetical protein
MTIVKKKALNIWQTSVLLSLVAKLPWRYHYIYPTTKHVNFSRQCCHLLVWISKGDNWWISIDRSTNKGVTPCLVSGPFALYLPRKFLVRNFIAVAELWYIYISNSFLEQVQLYWSDMNDLILHHSCSVCTGLRTAFPNCRSWGTERYGSIVW